MPAKRDLQRHALLRPARHELERRPDDPDQVAVVLLAEVGFDLAAVIVYWFRSHTILRPCSVRSASTCWISGVSGAMTPAGRRWRRTIARCRRARRSSAAPAPRPSRRSRRTGPTPSRRPSSGRRRVAGLRTSMRGSRAARWNSASAEICTPGQIAPPRYSPFALIASSVVAVPKSTTISGAARALAVLLVGRDAVHDAIGADFGRVRRTGSACRVRRPARRPAPSRRNSAATIAARWCRSAAARPRP